MFRRTIPKSRMVSTSGGQRRILKRSFPLLKEWRLRIDSGIFHGLKYREDNLGRKAPIPPVEYEIMSLNPPLPHRPTLPARERVKLRAARREAEARGPKQYIDKYIKRKQSAMKSTTQFYSEEERYAQLLGVPPKHSSMGQKSILLSNAYSFAMKQYEVLRQNEDMTEEESLDIVEAMLEKQKEEERKKSRSTAKAIEQWRQENESPQRKESAAAGAAEDSTIASKKGEVPPAGKTSPEEERKKQEEELNEAFAPSILHGQPRAVRGMWMWSQRLNAVPYEEWTIGAITALDHWIARSILGLSENAWNKVLEGHVEITKEDGAPHDELATGRDIVAVRQALFPETILNKQGDMVSDYGEENEEEEDDKKSEADRSIDDLLATLGGFSTSEPETKQAEKASANIIGQLVDELQQWREKQQDSEFEKWAESEQHEFNSWLKKYIDIVMGSDQSQGSGRKDNVDMVETRKALLSEPPTTRDENEDFWGSLQDETEAQVLLDHLLKQGVPEASPIESPEERRARLDYITFLQLPYKVQLQKLLNLGALRPLLDEYMEQERLPFLRLHASKLLEGVPVEHLILDPNGPIKGEDVSDDLLTDEEKAGRYRIEKLPYGSTYAFDGEKDVLVEKSTRARELYRAWNVHKASRARYEESMIKKGEMTLTGERIFLSDEDEDETE